MIWQSQIEVFILREAKDAKTSLNKICTVVSEVSTFVSKFTFTNDEILKYNRVLNKIKSK